MERPFEQVKLDLGHQGVGAVLVSAGGSYAWPTATLTEPDVVIVEPYLAGTSTGQAAQALRGVRHRLLALGVSQAELRRYGTTAEHDAAHGLDIPGLRHAIDEFLTS